jgi:hypothetical protein
MSSAGLCDFLFRELHTTVSVCVVADFRAPHYQAEMVLMRAANLDIYYFPRHYV